MAVPAESDPQPGSSRSILFVGSNTAPNTLGLRWFLDRAWSDVKRQVPDATLLVAGGVGRNLPSPPEGVELLGPVDDLGALYREAGVVISPLNVGSGLKIKLIEALGRGKAVVATSPTVEGVENIVGSAVAVTDDPAEFASAIARLLGNKVLRGEKGLNALEIARRYFSPAACYAEILDFAGPPVHASCSSSQADGRLATTDGHD
jgi:succinoglycan biosynthesis protein ExoO